MSEVLVLGNGHLGTYIAGKIGALLYRNRMEELYDTSGIDVIINAAGKTDLAWCEINPAETVRINAAYPVLLFNRFPNTKLIQLSSGCVWDGPYNASGRPFEPTDRESPACMYTIAKAAGDHLLMEAAQGSKRIAILRLRMPYSPIDSPRNLFTKLRSYPNLIDDPNSITSADTIVKTIRRLLESPSGRLWGRISNVYDRCSASPYRIGTMLADAGLRAAPGRMEKSQLDKVHRPKRVNTVMHDAVFEAEVDPPLVEHELKRVIESYKKEPG
jgi:dTDP-4-dehydrorhamnose reductase